MPLAQKPQRCTPTGAVVSISDVSCAGKKAGSCRVKEMPDETSSVLQVSAALHDSPSSSHWKLELACMLHALLLLHALRQREATLALASHVES